MLSFERAYKNNYMKLIYRVIFIVLLMNSCGLKYEQLPTLEDKDAIRKSAIENYMFNEFKNDSLQYQPLSWEKTTVIKPYSYQVLDSLYSIKYKLEKQGKYDAKLEEKIGIQKQILANDTSSILWDINHIYALNYKNTSEVQFSTFTLNNKDEIKTVTLNDVVEIPKKHVNHYLLYLKNESFLHQGFSATSNEQGLYLTFKNEEELKSGEERYQIIEKAMNMIDIAVSVRSASPKDLCKAVIIKQLENRVYNPTIDRFSSVDGAFENEVLIGYYATYQKPSGTIEVKLNPFFEIIEIKNL